MTKYKCLNPNCNHVFDGDVSTMNCPVCGSSVKKVGHPEIPWKIIAIIAACLGFIIFLIAILSTPNKIVATLEQLPSGVCVTADGITKSNCKDYVVEIELNGEPCDNRLSFNNDRSGTFLFEDMKVGTYSFKVIRRDRAPITIRWKNSNTYTKEPEPEAPIITAKGIERDRTAMVWKVEVKLVNTVTQNGVSYTLNGKTQASNIFTNIAPGTYTITAKNAAGLEGTYTLILPNIKPLQAKLSMSDMNNILAQVHSRSLSLGEARMKFSDTGDIQLKRSIDGYSTLFDILAYTRQSGAPQYTVVSCEYDQNNQIVSGSLVLQHQ